MYDLKKIFLFNENICFMYQEHYTVLCTNYRKICIIPQFTTIVVTPNSVLFIIWRGLIGKERWINSNKVVHEPWLARLIHAFHILSERDSRFHNGWFLAAATLLLSFEWAIDNEGAMQEERKSFQPTRTVQEGAWKRTARCSPNDVAIASR